MDYREEVKVANVNCRLYGSQLAALDRMAREQRVTRSRALRRLIDKALAQEQTPDTVRADVL